MTAARRFRLALAFVVILAAACFAASADGSEEPAGGHDGGDHPLHKHGIGLFLGVTDEDEHGSEATVGVNYEYRLGRRWGVGGNVDYAGGDARNTVLAAMGYFHPVRELKLMLGPGIEHHNGSGGHDGDHDNFVVRVGAAYDFEIGERFGIAPVVVVDFVDGETVLVYGVDFDVKF